MIEEVVVMAQQLEGKIIHDDAATHHGHYIKEQFLNLKKRHGYSLTGANGTAEESPMLGTINQDGEYLYDVIYLPNLNYQIHSEYQLIEVEKWTIKYFDDYSIIYGRFYNGVYQERVYSRQAGETHKVLTHTNIEILVIDIHDGKYTATIRKMKIEHENHGHPHPKVMVQVCDHYSPHLLNYTKTEALLYLKYWEATNGDACDACMRGRSIRRSKTKNGRVIYTELVRYGDKQGLHIDAFYFGSEFVFLIIVSHKWKMVWTKQLPIDFNARMVQDTLD